MNTASGPDAGAMNLNRREFARLASGAAVLLAGCSTQSRLSGILRRHRPNRTESFRSIFELGWGGNFSTHAGFFNHRAANLSVNINALPLPRVVLGYQPNFSVLESNIALDFRTIEVDEIGRAHV